MQPGASGSSGRSRRGAAWPIGKLVGGDWELVGVLGQGGVGTVYRARSRRTGGQVALKVLSGECTPARRERLRREAQLTAAIAHPGVVELLSTGEEDGAPYLVYELIEGTPLDAQLRSLARDEALAIVRDVAAALGHVHARGVVHRDVKPQNVLLDRLGRPRLVDFGLGWAPELESLTNTGALLGTPLWAAPEQLRDPRGVGPTADVWSLGVILYEVLTGRRPFSGSSLLELLLEVDRAAPPPPRALDPGIPPALERICLRALAPAPADRWPDGAALARELDAWLVGRRARWTAPRRAPGLRRAGVLALGLAATSLAVWFVAPGRGTAEAPAPTAPVAASATPVPAPSGPGDPAYRAAQEAMAAGDFATADALLPRSPETAFGWVLRGACRRALDDPAGALAAFERALELDPGHLDALIGRAHQRRLEGAPERALPDLLRATQLDPGFSEGWHFYGSVLLDLGRLEEARRALDRAIELAPGHVSSWINRGSARARAGDWEGGLADYDQALTLEPGKLNALEWRGRTLLHLERWAEALADFDRVLAQGGDGVELRADRATALTRLGREASGLPDLERALELAPDRLDLLLRRGLVRGNAGDARGSFEDLDRYIAAAPSTPSAEAFSGRGRANGHLGRKAEAEADYSRAIELEPTHATARNNRAMLRLERDAFAEALADLDALIAARPQVPQPHNNRAAALLGLGRAAEALAAADRALTLQPDYGSALRNRARARAALGDPAGARVDYLEALRRVAPGEQVLEAQIRRELDQLGAAPTR